MPSPQRGSERSLPTINRRLADHPFSAVRRRTDIRRETDRSFVEGPRIASTIDLPGRGFGVHTSTRSKPRLAAQSLQGHTSRGGRGLPTALPVDYRLVLARDSRFGLRRYERAFTQSRL
jgi:hypothetical protein